MNRKIPFHELASLLAANCNISDGEAEEFIKSFFDLISQSLTDGEQVKIKGIGVFSITGNHDNPVSFIPDAEIADTINAPFSLFEPEIINEAVSNEELKAVDAQESSTTQSAEHSNIDNVPKPDGSADNNQEPPTVTQQSVERPNEERPAVIADETKPDDEIASEIKPSAESTHVDTQEENAVTKTDNETRTTSAATVETSAQHPIVQTPIFPEDEPEEYIEEENQQGSTNHGFGKGFFLGLIVGLAIGACGVYFAIDYLFPITPVATETETAIEENALPEISPDEIPDTSADTATNDTLATAAPATVDSTQDNSAKPIADTTKEPVKDTVKAGYLLHDMAKKHYGNKCFWVYIYEENKSIISNPNRVRPGLVLVIPPAEKYGINSSDASIRTANEKAGKILSKYRN